MGRLKKATFVITVPLLVPGNPASGAELYEVGRAKVATFSVAGTWHGMAWHGMVDVCDGCLAAESSGYMAWHGINGMVEVCEGAPVAVSGWVLTDRHDLSAMCS